MTIQSIRRAKYILKLIILLILFCYSCIPQRSLEYMRSKQGKNVIYSDVSKEIERIEPCDQLYIRVSSFDDVSYNFFSTQADNSQMNYGNEIAINLVSYTVNDSGSIYFPIIGDIYLMDLTIEEATEKMQKLLSEYFNQPTVLIKHVNKKITILGEVRNPGHYIYTKERLNIFEALSIAGDITIHGNKRQIILIRERDNKIFKNTVDLRNDKIIISPHFYLHSDDIIYVKSRSTALWSITASTYSLILSSITTFLLILRYLET